MQLITAADLVARGVPFVPGTSHYGKLAVIFVIT
jgi:hypothetical protein